MDIQFVWLFTNECIVFCIVFVSHTRLDLSVMSLTNEIVSLVFVQKFKFILMKMHKNCCYQSCSVWLRYAPNRLSAGAQPQTALGELTSLPQIP